MQESPLDAIFAHDDPVVLVGELKEHIGRIAVARGWDSLGPVARGVIDVWWFEAEVLNGGFHQFFWNSTGDRTLETLAALERIGAKKAAGLLAKGIALFAERPSIDRETRIGQMNAWSEAEIATFEALDDAFYRSRERLMALVARDSRKHRELLSSDLV